MWPFSRKREETLNEQLLREAGLADEARAEPVDDAPAASLDPRATGQSS